MTAEEDEDEEVEEEEEEETVAPPAPRNPFARGGRTFASPPRKKRKVCWYENGKRRLCELSVYPRVLARVRDKDKVPIDSCVWVRVCVRVYVV